MIRRFENYYEHSNKMIGQGVFAQVFLGKRKSTNEQVAVKINHVMSQKEKDILAILQKNTHAHVIGIVDIFDQNGQLYIVEEFCRGGTLYDLMLQGMLSEETAVETIYQVAEGLKFLHGLSIVHGDIKPENILRQIGKDGREVFKITDFGLSSLDECMINTKVGTAYYVAPEIVNGRADRDGYDKSVDIWALGLMFDELLHGSPFFNGATEEEVFNRIKSEAYFIRNKEVREASFFDGTKFVLQQCLINLIHVEPTCRKDIPWLLDQLNNYRITRRKSSIPPKTNKQLFTQQASIADGIFDYLNTNFTTTEPNSEQKFQSSKSVQQIQQKYTKQVEDPEQLCPEHRLPLKFRVPRMTVDLSTYVQPACLQCLRYVGVYETETLQKMVDEALIQCARFEYLYRNNEIVQQLNVLQAQWCTQDLEIRHNGNTRLREIQEEHEARARVIHCNRIRELESFKARGCRGEESWVNDCLQIKNPDNAFISEMKKDMQNLQEACLHECQSLVHEKMQQVMKILREKLQQQ